MTALPHRWPHAPRQRSRATVPLLWLAIALGVTVWSLSPLVAGLAPVTLWPIGAALIGGAGWGLAQVERDQRAARTAHDIGAAVAAAAADTREALQVLHTGLQGNHDVLVARLAEQHQDLLAAWQQAVQPEPAADPAPYLQPDQQLWAPEPRPAPAGSGFWSDTTADTTSDTASDTAAGAPAVPDRHARRAGSLFADDDTRTW